ncbi:hypothetical protein Tco_0863790 [Tanacetum coccineum]
MFMTEIAKRLGENTNLIRELRAFMDFALRYQKASIKALEIQVRQMSIILHEKLSGNLQSSIIIKPRINDEMISTSVETNKPSIRRIDAKDVPWVDEKPWTDTGVWKEPKPVKHTCKPFTYKTGCSEWPTCSWRNDGFCNGGNLPGAYMIGNSLHYQDYKLYKALEDRELKEDALGNKAIMEGLIDNDNDDKSLYQRKKRWNVYDDTNHDHEHEIDHEADEREELCEFHELSVCTIRIFLMIKYSFGQDGKYVAVKENKYDDLARANKNAC